MTEEGNEEDGLAAMQTLTLPLVHLVITLPQVAALTTYKPRGRHELDVTAMWIVSM